MTAKASLDLKGVIQSYPLAEVLLEISQAGLSGALRVETGERKVVIYFIDGEVAYVVSNEKRFRLFKVMLDSGVIDAGYLAQNRAVLNDLQLCEKIKLDGKLSEDELNTVISSQCESVIESSITWTDGEWTFSPHSRLKSDVKYKVNLKRILRKYAVTLDSEIASNRLIDPNERFNKLDISYEGLELGPQEAFILSRLEKEPISLSQVSAMIGAAMSDLPKHIYSLWLGGHLCRTARPPAFSDERIAYLRSTDLELKKPAKIVIPATVPKPVEKVTEAPEPEPSEADAPFDLEGTLARIENAQNAYDVLGLQPSVNNADIRKAYYRLAKMLHPDKYRREYPDSLQRIEKAFTELAQAHESIKTPEVRQGYDLRMRQLESERASTKVDSDETDKPGGQADVDFERGFALQLEGEFEAAVPFLARAAYYEPKNARYRAYYGKALSADENQRHKAEKELVTSVQLEPSNPTFRLMLAEFFLKYKLIKRAEGELNRLLEMSPGNKEALRLLDRLQGG